MGVVYLARDPTIDRLVAVKVLHAATAEMRERFYREARTAGRLQHPNIVTIYDVGEHEGEPFIAMEYVPGETLAQIIRRRAPLPIGRKLDLLDDLCLGLACAHRAGLIHRDVKPSNLVVSPEGPLKILDFGIARLADSSMTQSGALIGTPNYMSPEQVAGRPVDHRSDIFAVGLTVYELLAYRPAFPGTAIPEVFHRILHEDPPPLTSMAPELDPALETIVARALQKDPGRRYQDLDAMRLDLRAVARRLREAGLEETVVAVPAAAPAAAATPPVSPPRATPDLAAIAQRRAEQLARRLDEAERARARGDLKLAFVHVEEAALLDPDDARVVALIGELRAALDAEQVRAWLDEARVHIEAGALAVAMPLVEQALALDPGSVEAARLRREIEEAYERRERQAASRREVERLVAAAQARLDAGDLDEAEASSRRAAAIAPDDPGVRSLAAAIASAREREAARTARAEADALLARARVKLDEGCFEDAAAAIDAARACGADALACDALEDDLQSARVAALADAGRRRVVAALAEEARRVLGGEDGVSAARVAEAFDQLVPGDPDLADLRRRLAATPGTRPVGGPDAPAAEDAGGPLS
jgi:tetratricopeptide (TPR) repeat protein